MHFKSSFYKIVFLLLVLFVYSCRREGCTDPNAINYDPKADEQSYDCKYLQPPALLAPADKNSIANSSVTFKWEKSDFATAYIFQVAEDSLFQNLFHNTQEEGLTVTVNNFAHAKKYFWRVKSLKGELTKSVFSDAKSFQINLNATLPEVKTLSISNISLSSAICNGSVYSDGGASIIERGICYGTNANPSIMDTKTINGSGTGDFSGNLNNLNKGTVYYARAFATNGKGTAYGSVLEFKTYSSFVHFSRYELNSDNNKDGFINKGEDISLSVYLKNTGTSQAKGVIGKISCADNYISGLSQPYNSFNNILAESESSYYTNISFKVSDLTPNGTVITFNIAITDESNNTSTESFTVTVVSTKADVHFSRYELSSENNKDGFINKGEDVSLKVYLKNNGTSQANGVIGKISCTSNYISAFSQPYNSFSNILSGFESGYSTNISFKVSNVTPPGTVITFNIAITDESKNTWTDSFTITVVSTKADVHFSRYELNTENNNDRLINKGEDVSLSVYLKNTGTSQANGVTGKISCTNNYISAFSQPYTSYSNILSGSESGYYTNINFKVSNSTPPGTVITFNIAITDESNNTWTDSFTITVVSTKAEVHFSRFELSSDNNKDGFINKGEDISLKVYLKNTGTSQVNGVIGKVSCTDSYISGFSQPYNSFSNILSGSESGSYTNISFKVSNLTPPGTVITFTVAITDESNNTWTDSFTITVVSTKAEVRFSRYELNTDNNKDGLINKGEDISLSVYLKNIGTSQANGVIGKISCTDNYISGLSQPYNSFSNILSGSESGYYTNISFKVSNLTPTGTVITFNIVITDESNNTWTDSFTARVY